MSYDCIMVSFLHVDLNCSGFEESMWAAKMEMFPQIGFGTEVNYIWLQQAVCKYALVGFSCIIKKHISAF